MALTPEGVISDNDAVLMKLYRGAKEFDMRANYSQTISGTITIRKWWFDSNNYQWQLSAP